VSTIFAASISLAMATRSPADSLAGRQLGRIGRQVDRREALGHGLQLGDGGGCRGIGGVDGGAQGRCGQGQWGEELLH
jgi:hypothetical protein